MEVRNNEAKIYIVCGKARHGKTTSAELIHDYCENHNLKHIDLSYGSYIKEYAKKISNWDGSEETKPRELLQQLGTNIIREKLDDEFFIKRMIEDIKVYNFFFDVITISDARFPKEIDLIKAFFKNVKSIHIIRPNFDNGLTLEQQNHPSEIALNSYQNYDYEIINDSTLEELNEKIVKIMEEER